jgi:hypothetical protein
LRRQVWSGEAAVLHHLHIEAGFLDRRHVGLFGNALRVESREQPHLPGFALRTEFLNFADANIERAVEDVEHHLAAAFISDDGGIDAGSLLQSLGGLALERGRIGGAPASPFLFLRGRSHPGGS